MKQRVVIIGGGLGGLAAACLLGKVGYDVTVLEKNHQLGGRAGRLEAAGFTFDTGPSWYLMTDVFEHFFSVMGEDITTYLDLMSVTPNYRVFYKGTGQHLDITNNLAANMTTFERIERGAGMQLQKYLAQSRRTYEAVLRDYAYRNFDTLRNIGVADIWRAARIGIPLGSMHRHVANYFHDPRLQKILLYPSVFLGTDPYRAPAVYSMLSHTDLNQKMYYPRGGIYSLTQALVSIGRAHNVRYRLQSPAEKIIVKNGRVAGVICKGKELYADIIISNAGVQYTETRLLTPSQRDHAKGYWQKRVVAPSGLLLYLGVARQFPSLAHHNLLFAKYWRRHFADIFDTPRFPADPSLYVCAPAKTDPGVAPRGMESLFVVVPVAAGLRYTPKQLEAYAEMIIATMEQELELPGLSQAIRYQRLFCVRDFAEQFNSLQGTALGLAHTWGQSAMFRPRNQSKKVEGLYYAGADVHPGIGMPCALISAELVYKRLTGDRSRQPLASLPSQ